MPSELPGRHPRAGGGRHRRRPAARLAALATAGAVAAAAVTWLVTSAVSGKTAQPAMTARASQPDSGMAAASAQPGSAGPAASQPAASAPARSALVPSARARRSCPPAASVCADLAGHLTWLQSAGRVSYGPVRMEPGTAADPTPRGTFHVAWKAGPNYVSTSYGVPIPYAVFFAAGGVAFHAGSLTMSSHGCIHLSLANARYYHDHLPAGAEVVVF